MWYRWMLEGVIICKYRLHGLWVYRHQVLPINIHLMYHVTEASDVPNPKATCHYLTIHPVS